MYRSPTLLLCIVRFHTTAPHKQPGAKIQRAFSWKQEPESRLGWPDTTTAAMGQETKGWIQAHGLESNPCVFFSLKGPEDWPGA